MRRSSMKLSAVTVQRTEANRIITMLSIYVDPFLNLEQSATSVHVYSGKYNNQAISAVIVLVSGPASK